MADMDDRTRPSTTPGQPTLEPAHDLFMTQGYAATRTLQIAERAGVTEQAIFRHFGSKAELFGVSVAEPFSGFIDDYLSSWKVYPTTAPPEFLIDSFFKGFYELVTRHKKVLVTLIGAEATDGGTSLTGLAQQVCVKFSRALRGMQQVAVGEGERRGIAGMDPPVTVGALAGMVMSTGSFRLDNDDRVETADSRSYMAIHGIMHRPEVSRSFD